MCTSVGVDNTSVNIGIRNSLKHEYFSEILLFTSMVILVMYSIMRHRKLVLPLPLVNLMQKSSLV